MCEQKKTFQNIPGALLNSLPLTDMLGMFKQSSLNNQIII